MRCDEVQERLDDHIEGTLHVSDVTDVAAHLEACLSCRQEEADIRAILAAARALPTEIAPPRDLWPGICDRIDRRFSFDFAWGGLQWALASAAIVLIAVAGLLVRGVRNDEKPAVAAAIVASDRTAHLTPASSRTAATLASAEGEFERASEELLAVLESRRADLPPNTIEALKGHLVAIDTALEQIRDVLRQNPGNAEATRLLASTQRRKVDVLRRFVGLSRI